MLKPAKPEIKSENNQNQACLADRDTPFLYDRKLRPIIQKRSARMRTRRKGRWLPKQPRLGARMCQGTFFFMVSAPVISLLMACRSPVFPCKADHIKLLHWPVADLRSHGCRWSDKWFHRICFSRKHHEVRCLR